MSIATKVKGLRAVLFFDNWPMLVLQRVFYRDTGLVIYRKNGLEFVVDHKGHDENGTRNCLISDMYRKYLASFSLPQRARVLDLGANGGGFPLLLRAEGIGIETVVCVEMGSQVVTRLTLNLATNFGPAAVAVHAAVCDTSQRKEIALTRNRGGTAISIEGWQADRASDADFVDCVSLPALAATYFPQELIDICKVDIEGAEYEVFESSDDAVLRSIRYLIIELHDRARTPKLLDKIARLGFTDITLPGDAQPEKKDEIRCFRGPAA